MALDPNTTAVILIEFQNDFTSEGGALHEAVSDVMKSTDMMAHAGAVVEAGAVVGPDVVLGQDARVAAGAHLERSVVWPGVTATGRHAAIMTARGRVRRGRRAAAEASITAWPEAPSAGRRGCSSRRPRRSGPAARSVATWSPRSTGRP